MPTEEDTTQPENPTAKGKDQATTSSKSAKVGTRYFVPEYEVSVEAESLEEAIKKAKAQSDKEQPKE